MARYGFSGSAAYKEMSRKGSVTNATLTRGSEGNYQLTVTTDRGSVVANQAMGSDPDEAAAAGAVVHDAVNYGIVTARGEYAARQASRAAADKSWAEKHAERRGRGHRSSGGQGHSGAYSADVGDYGGE